MNLLETDSVNEMKAETGEQTLIEKYKEAASSEQIKCLRKQQTTLHFCIAYLEKVSNEKKSLNGASLNSAFKAFFDDD